MTPSTISFLLGTRRIEMEFSPSGRYSPTTTLLEFLRSLPDRKGTKEGCGQGDCGACTVVLAEPSRQGGLTYTAVNSCLVLLPMVHGKQLLTVEDLKSPCGSLHPIQQAMIDEYGSQCGFCTPGILMTLFALFKQKSNPTQEEIVTALAGNLCRCTGYLSIFRAAQQIAGQGRQDWLDDQESETLSRLRSIPCVDLHLAGNGLDYFRPVSLPAALSFRQAHCSAVAIGGATDVALQLGKKLQSPTDILDLSAIAELSEYRRDSCGITLGSGMKLRDVAVSIQQSHPALRDILVRFGSSQIRALATIAGNIGSASPIGDTLPALMAYNSVVQVSSLTNTRSIPLTEFLIDYRRTALQPNEIIISLFIPHPNRSDIVRAYKVSKRRDVDIATVNAGFRLRLDTHGRAAEIVLAYGGMSTFTRRACLTEQFLMGKEWTRENAESAGWLIAKDFQPISDVRGSAEFRMTAARNLLLKFWSDTQVGEAT